MKLGIVRDSSVFGAYLFLAERVVVIIMATCFIVIVIVELSAWIMLGVIVTQLGLSLRAVSMGPLVVRLVVRLLDFVLVDGLFVLWILVEPGVHVLGHLLPGRGSDPLQVLHNGLLKVEILLSAGHAGE